MAFQADLFFVQHAEFGCELLDIGDAVWVEALYDAFDEIWCFDNFFICHLEIPDFNDGCMGCDEGNFI